MRSKSVWGQRTEEEHILRLDGSARRAHQTVHPEAEVAVRLEAQNELHETSRRARAQRECGELAARHQTLAGRHHSARRAQHMHMHTVQYCTLTILYSMIVYLYCLLITLRWHYEDEYVACRRAELYPYDRQIRWGHRRTAAACWHS